MPKPSKDLPSHVYRTSDRFINEAKELGRCLRAHRKARGWTLDQAAEKASMEYQHIQKIESGQLNVTLITLVRLSEAFGVRVLELFTEPAPPEAPTPQP